MRFFNNKVLKGVSELIVRFTRSTVPKVRDGLDSIFSGLEGHEETMTGNVKED